MDINEKKKEQLKKAIRHPEPDKKKKEFTTKQKEELEKGKKKGKIDPKDELRSREEFRDKKGKKEKE